MVSEEKVRKSQHFRDFSSSCQESCRTIGVNHLESNEDLRYATRVRMQCSSSGLGKELSLMNGLKYQLDVHFWGHKNVVALSFHSPYNSLTSFQSFLSINFKKRTCLI